MRHPIPGFDYGCGTPYFHATPERQARARLDYWHDRLARVQRQPLRDCDLHLVPHICADATAGIREAKQAIGNPGAAGERKLMNKTPIITDEEDTGSEALALCRALVRVDQRLAKGTAEWRMEIENITSYARLLVGAANHQPEYPR